MTRGVHTTDKQIACVAFELAEQFFKRVPGTHTAQDTDDLAEALDEAIHDWLWEKSEPEPA